jgi:hypothetical protein
MRACGQVMIEAMATLYLALAVTPQPSLTVTQQMQTPQPSVVVTPLPSVVSTQQVYTPQPSVVQTPQPSIQVTSAQTSPSSDSAAFSSSDSAAVRGIHATDSVSSAVALGHAAGADSAAVRSAHAADANAAAVGHGHAADTDAPAVRGARFTRSMDIAQMRIRLVTHHPIGRGCDL